MGKKNDRKLLAEKYRKGLCTQEEIRLIESWYHNLDEHGYELPNEQEIDRASDEATVNVIRQVAQLQKQKTIKRVLWQAGTAAAVILLVFNFWPMKEQGDITSFANTDVQKVITTTGEKRKLTLPDGSSIVLNAGSTIRYPHNFRKGIREIHLEGQAFFNVIPDSDRPFIVYTKDLTVKVLGTSFDVQAYGNDKQAVVRVESGKVAVSRPGHAQKQLALLHKGEQFDYNKNQKTVSTSTVDVKKIRDWQENILHFEFVPLINICKELERIYGIPIVIENNAIQQERYHLNVKGETIENILFLLSKSGKGFTYENKNGKIIIR